MRASKDQVHFLAALVVQPGHRRIKAHRPVRRHHSTPPPPHRVVLRRPVLDLRLIPPVFRHPRIIPVRRTMGPGPVRSGHLPVRHRNSSADPAPRDHRLYLVPVILIFRLTVNRSADHNMVYHLEARSDQEDILWLDLWDLDTRRWWDPVVLLIGWTKGKFSPLFLICKANNYSILISKY